MEITSISTAYTMETNDYAVKKNNGVDRKSETNKVEEYYEKLCKKFPKISFNTQGGVMPCNPSKAVVNLSPDCLKKMANDPEFAKEIEWNLSGEEKANALIYSWAKRDGIEIYGKTVTYDANGNRQSSYGMRTANVSTQNNGTTNVQNQKKLSKSRRDKRREQEESLEKIREKRKEEKEYLENLREKHNDIDGAIGDRIENGSLAVKAYTRMEFDSADVLSALDKKI